MDRFRTIQERFNPLLKKLLNGMLRDPALVDDAYFEVLVALRSKLEKDLLNPAAQGSLIDAPESRIGAWLKRVARNQALRFLRGKAKFSQVDVDDFYVDGYHLQEELWLMKQLHDCMLSLDPRSQELLALLMSGKSIKELATELKMTPKTFKRRCLRAATAFRNAVDSELSGTYSAEDLCSYFRFARSLSKVA